MPFGGVPASGNSVITPVVVTLPILFESDSTNQRLASGPTVISVGWLASVGIGNSMRSPAGVIRPILFAADSVNQRLPSGPDVMPVGPRPAGIGNSEIMPAVLIRPILSVPVNQRALASPPLMSRAK